MSSFLTWIKKCLWNYFTVMKCMLIKSVGTDEPFGWTDWVGECEMPTTSHSCMCQTWQWVTVTLSDINTAEHSFQFFLIQQRKSHSLCGKTKVEIIILKPTLINHENNHVHCCYITHISIQWKVCECFSGAVIGACIQKNKACGTHHPLVVLWNLLKWNTVKHRPCFKSIPWKQDEQSWCLYVRHVNLSGV